MRGWTVDSRGGLTRLVYGRLGTGQADFAVICDTDAGIVELVYPIGRAEGLRHASSTELLIAADDEVDNLPAEVRTDGLGTTIVARTRIPPRPVAGWVGKTITVGTVGRATTLTTPPNRPTITDFLAACRRRT